MNAPRRQPAEWIERTARLGYFAVGCVYIIGGLMTAAAAAGAGGHTSSWHEAIAAVSRAPLGVFALIVIGVGLTGYAAWGIISGFTDSDQRGNDLKGLALRARNIASGIFHATLAFSLFRFALTNRGGGSGSDRNAQHWTGKLMDVPFGRWLVAVSGMVLIGYGLASLWRAWQAKLGQRLHVPATVPGRALLVAVCRFGIAARGIVVGIVGSSLIEAAIHHNPERTRATRGALQSVGSAPHGAVLLFIIAVGLAAYGVYAIVKGRYRTVKV